MKRLIFAIFLLSAFAVPAAASVRNGLAQVRPHSEREVMTHLSKLKRAPAQANKDDPYWQPCDYTSSYSENSCSD